MNKEEEKFLKGIKPVSQYSERTELRDEIIKLVALGGFAAACLVAPGLAHAAKLFPELSGKENLRLQRQLRSLEDRGLIVKKGEKYFLTSAGTLYNNKLKIKEFTLEKKDKRKWDKKWHIVMFDVPNSHNESRASFRNKLKEFDFVLVQKSVYLSPFDYSKELKSLASLHDIKIDIVTATLERIDDEDTYKKIFKLK